MPLDPVIYAGLALLAVDELVSDCGKVLPKLTRIGVGAFSEYSQACVDYSPITQLYLDGSSTVVAKGDVTIRETWLYNYVCTAIDYYGLPVASVKMYEPQYLLSGRTYTLLARFTLQAVMVSVNGWLEGSKMVALNGDGSMLVNMLAKALVTDNRESFAPYKVRAYSKGKEVAVAVVNKNKYDDLTALISADIYPKEDTVIDEIRLENCSGKVLVRWYDFSVKAKKGEHLRLETMIRFKKQW